MTAPGEPCTLSPFDWFGDGPDPAAGDQLVTAAGSAYLVLDARRVTPRNPLPAGVQSRWSLRCVKLAARDVDPAGRTIDMRWNRR